MSKNDAGPYWGNSNLPLERDYKKELEDVTESLHFAHEEITKWQQRATELQRELAETQAALASAVAQIRT